VEPHLSPDLAPEKGWPVWGKAFIAHFSLTGNSTASAAAAGVTRRAAELLRERDETFAAAWAEAREEAADHLEDEARRRAVDGWEEPVYGSGGPGRGTEEVGTIRRFDSTLLIFLLKGARPEKYRERFDTKLSGSLDLGTVVAAAHASAIGGADE